MGPATAFIPARYQSSRFPGKPLANINGIPMIQRVYQRIAGTKGLHDVYVATEDERIADVVRSFGGKVIMTAADAVSGTDRVAEAAAQLKLDDDHLVINIQGDQPLIHSASIEDVIRPFQHQQDDFSMSTLVFRVAQRQAVSNARNVKVVLDNDGFALYFSRATIPYGRESEEHDFFKHIGVYAYRCGFLKCFCRLPPGRLERIEMLEQLRVLEYGYRIKVAISDYDSPEVNMPADIENVERLLAAGY